MPEHIKALIVILGLSSLVFALMQRPAFALPIAPADFRRRRNVWLGVTLIAFLAHSFWLYVLGVALLLLVSRRKETNPLGLYLLLLFAVPPFTSEIKGLGPIQQIFSINHIRLLALFILLPAWYSIRKQKDVTPFGGFWVDRIVVGYLAYQLILYFSGSTFTNALRNGVLYSFTDVFLPYYVASRSLRNIKHFRDAMASFITAAMILSVLAVFESFWHWLLYNTLNDALGVIFRFGGYLGRGDFGVIRATVSTGHGIVLGYVVAVAIFLYLGLMKSMPAAKPWWAGMSVLAVGLVCALSRGPWVGVAAGLLVFVILSPQRDKDLKKLVLLGGVAVVALMLSPYRDKLIDLIPFIGTADAGSVEYRQRLFSVSLQVIQQNLLFGGGDYINNPLMQELVQGEGIIDIVNSYIAVALAQGVVGLAFYVSVFLFSLAAAFGAWRAAKGRNDELQLIGRALIGVMIVIMVTITTASPILSIPVVYWLMSGLCICYSSLVRSELANTVRPPQQVAPERRPRPSRGPVHADFS